MITLKAVPYNDTEVSNAVELFTVMEDTFHVMYCPHGKLTYCKHEVDCEKCVNRHLCYDVSAIKRYVEKLHEERGCK